MTALSDVRKMMQAALGTLSPAKAQELAKSLEPGAAKEQVAKATADILEWSQHNRERIVDMIRKEVQHQLHQMGLATQDEMDALRKRVRELERAAGRTATRKKTAARKPAAKKPAAPRTPATGQATASGGQSG
ncbi:MAG: phasin family protein [Actinomycetota bacterium]|jgi:polyhydroxyalkanoate synthesis regulator phasin